MKKFASVASLNLLVLLGFAALLTFGSCSSPKQYFSFSPAPPAYVKKSAATPVKTTLAATATSPTNNPDLMASTAPEQKVVLPEVIALPEKAPLIPATLSKTTQPDAAIVKAKPASKLSLPQKMLLQKMQKQAKKLSNQSPTAESAAGPVSNRNAMALILIGLIVAVLGSFLGGIFYTLGVLILIVGLVLLVLNYV